MPVSSILSAGTISVKPGAFWCMGRYSFAFTSPLPSMGWPTTLNMRPRVSSPTGISMGIPVGVTWQPRERPSVEARAMQRTVLPPSSCTTSAVTEPWPFSSSTASYMAGSCPWGKRTSTTGPTTLQTVPFSILFSIPQSVGPAHNLGDLRGYLSLTGPV